MGVTIQIPSNTNGFSSFSPLHCNFMGILHCRTHPNILLLLEHFMKYSWKAACKYPIVHFAHLYPHILPIKYPLHISIYLQIFLGCLTMSPCSQLFVRRTWQLARASEPRNWAVDVHPCKEYPNGVGDRLQQWWFNRGLMGGWEWWKSFGKIHGKFFLCSKTLVG